MKNAWQFGWFVVFVLVTLVGCGSQQIQPTATSTLPSPDAPTATPALPTATKVPVTQTPTSESREVPMTPTSANATSSDPALQGLIRQAKEDLAARLSVSVEEIEVVRAEVVVWPDSSLGCPQPGMAYTQVQVDGALIELKAGGRLYSYHSGGMREPFLCETPNKPTPPSQLPGFDSNDS